MTQPPQPPDDPWPASDDPTIISREDAVVGPPPPVGPPPDRHIGAGMLLGLGAVALVAVGILVAYLLTHRHKDHPVTTTVTTASSTTAAAKVVAGKVAVPNVTGQSLADAQAKLRAAGLSPTKTEVASDQPVGTVLDQAPAAGSKLAKGSQVTLSVAKARAATVTTIAMSTVTTTATTTTTAPTTTAAAPAPQNPTMADITGQSEASAVQAMNRVGILASLVFVPGQDPLGTVTQQAKPAGATVPYHSHVQLNLSKGPNASTDEQVPNVVGQTLPQALDSVNGAHLRLIYLKFPVTSKAQAGKIVQQSPLGGGQAPQNAQVLVYLGAFQG